ncbi:hypothetical protein AQUCO_01100021v1 [Aquilegia coerulea]|uniref:ATP-dependent DNA helicase n=1 Tax=Aquilegia coerulea TaxID=218851 RepID=A0A2G5E5A0_AQUCA|nr:hypothetical protein AQUCO_01100021v1 [Aquilegia coerulea]
MEGNYCTTVVHPVSDSHYDTILEDEIHIPIDPVENVPKERHYLGKMDVICPSCFAYHWLDERLTKSTKKKSFFGMCCLQGKIKLSLLTPLPSAIKLLYEGRNSLARSFRKDIRFYNAANAFSSLGVSMDKRILKGRGPTSFTIHGQLSHQIGSLLPESNKSPSYSQLYIYDPHIALECRQKRNLHLNPAILKIIQEARLESNELCKIYKCVYDVLKSANSNGGESIPIRLAYTPTTDPRRYNLPTSEDIAVIIPGDETEPTSKRDIILHLKNNNLERISECHPLYLPSHYVLLFPTGDLGWSTDMKHWDVKNEQYFTVIGSPRHMYEIYQDSMAITRYYKHPDIFMTVTSNPKWPEIQNELKPGQAALDRPDLVARVFELKRKAIMHEIENKRLFGRVVANVYTIEFQKRGLPHMHTLLFLHPEDKIRTTDQVDRIVSAEFPDPIKHPALFETIKKCMVHGPCGTRNMESVCMENKVCKSRYPRENVNDTRIDVDGYPIYRRRKIGKSYHVRGHLVDNKDVVPYNPHLSEMLIATLMWKFVHHYKHCCIYSYSVASEHVFQVHRATLRSRYPDRQLNPIVVAVKVTHPDPSDSDVCDYGLFLMNDYLLESEITNSVRNDSRQVFFLSGPAGTGKTFVYNTVADTLRSEGHIVIMVASSGIASLLLTGGRTAHSTFKIPFEVLDDSVCSVTKQTIHAELFKRAKLIIWDEVPMQHRFCVEADDRTLRDIREIKEPFGGVTVVLGDDFKQTLHVITKGTRQEIVRACLTKSHLWSGVRLLTLVKNMRLNNNDTENVKFADYLIEIGTNPKEDVELPSEIKMCKSTIDLLFKVYPNLNVEEVATETYLQERSILSARNDDVATLNELAINHFPGELHEYLAADKAIEDDQPIENRGNSISNENMQALDPPSLPPFKLQLKVVCPIMLLRNLQPRDGLCNGTRLMVVQFATRVIEAKILNGSHVGNYVFIPRITLQPSVSETPFQMARRQFPVRLAFAMTINKSQGQSVKCTSSNRIFVLLGNEDDDKTTNVVYPEVLL